MNLHKFVERLKLTKIIKGKKGVINQDILRMVEGILQILLVDLL